MLQVHSRKRTNDSLNWRDQINKTFMTKTAVNRIGYNNITNRLLQNLEKKNWPN